MIRTAAAVPTAADAPPSSRTPMMQQYLLAKAEHPDCIVFFRMGDFYEMFFDDAVEAAGILGLTLTSRNKGAEDEVPMAGVPHHAKNTYLRGLLEAGRKVAICEQMEDPKQAKGIVRREVVQVVTPGVVLDMDSLDAGQNNYLVAVCQGARGHGLAVADVSTGELRATLLPDTDALASELLRLEPREILVEPGGRTPLEPALRRLPTTVVDELDGAAFHPKESVERLRERSLLPAGAPAGRLADEALRAAGALIAYLESTQRRLGGHLGALEPYDARDHLIVDDAAVAHLELVRTQMEGRKKGSLLGVLDRTGTAMGSRRLRQWLLLPLLDRARIEERLDRVQAFVGAPLERDELRGLLREVHDLERLNGRIATGVAGPRDLHALRLSLEALPRLRAVLEGLAAAGAPALEPLAAALDPLPELTAKLAAALVDEPPATLKDGGVFRAGFSPELDELNALARDGRSWLLDYEARERRRSGIGSLKVKFNKVFGYYIEVTKANLQNVPDDYIRKQTLVNGERFFTPELKEFEEKVLHAEERRVTLETSLFEDLRDEVGGHAPRILATARAVADLDVLVALAEVAHRERYVRPRLDDSRRLVLKGNRHPVIEQTTTDARFVPNDVTLDADEARLAIITGPNMAGKSTVMRQVALTVLMAQMGSFVPADEAHVGLVDRVFTRVGASDNLARGQSTFMVEMTETAHILRNATDRSLIVLDEIGRGTSTYDGVSIAWAVAEHIHDTIGARTLFATHYHELTDLVRTRPGARNWNIAVKEWNDEIVFLRKLVEGGASRSYGIQVGRLAGLPDPVVSRAKEILANLEAGELDEECQPRLSHSKRAKRRPDSRQLNLFAAPAAPPTPSAVEERLRALNPDTLSPLEALQALYELRKKLDGRG